MSSTAPVSHQETIKEINVEKLLRQAIPSELASAIDETPALIVPVLLTFAALEAIPRDGAFLAAIPAISFHVGTGCLAALIGVIFYSWGDFWDKKVFSPRYKPHGSWTKQTPSLFPSAENMVEARNKAADLLPIEDKKNQKGVYAAAEELVRSHGRWREVQSAIVISKFVRSFIWPSFLGCLALVVLALVRGRVSPEAAKIPLLFAACCLVIGAASFIPYFSFRLKHMEGLYRLAASLSKPSGTPTNGRVEADTITRAAQV